MVVADGEWERRHVLGTTTVLFESDSARGSTLRGRMQVQDPRRGEEKAGEPKSTQSLKHCPRHIKARHARKKKGTTRPIPGFFLTTAKRAKPNETPVMQEAPVVQVPAVAQVAGGDVNLSGGLVLDDEDVIMQQRRASLSCRKRAPSRQGTRMTPRRRRRRRRRRRMPTKAIS